MRTYQREYLCPSGGLVILRVPVHGTRSYIAISLHSCNAHANGRIVGMQVLWLAQVWQLFLWQAKAGSAESAVDTGS